MTRTKNFPGVLSYRSTCTCFFLSGSIFGVERGDISPACSANFWKAPNYADSSTISTATFAASCSFLKR